VEEYIDVALSAPSTVGIYPETKHPTWHNQLPLMQGTSMEDLLLEVLSDKGYGGAIGTQEWAAQPCFIQSFEVCASFQLPVHARSCCEKH
jgi:glycerophosphoryl diester phosphodiesterase